MSDTIRKNPHWVNFSHYDHDRYLERLKKGADGSIMTECCVEVRHGKLDNWTTTWGMYRTRKAKRHTSRMIRRHLNRNVHKEIENDAD